MAVRLSKVAREFNVGLSVLVEFLHSKGIKISNDPNSKLTDEDYNLIVKELSSDSEVKKEINLVGLKNASKIDLDTLNQKAIQNIKVVGKIDLDALNQSTARKAKEISSKVSSKRKNLNESNILFHIIVLETKPSMDEDYIRLSYNSEGYYAELPTLLYNKSTSILFSTIEKEDQTCSLYQILDRTEINNLLVPENDFFIVKGEYKYQLLLEELFNKLPTNFSIYNQIRNIHLELLYSEKKYIEDLEWSDSNRSLILALKTKPFVIMSGPSGTGKSHRVIDLAKSFYNLSKHFQHRYTPNYNLQAVKPNWFDSTELLGYISPNTQNFVDTEFLNFVQQAESQPNTPHFVCLDEMNLARVEYYFAELLSKIEMRFFNSDGKYGDVYISTISPHKYTFPANLFIVGTVNMDDTTHSFSRKVLDRAMIFEIPIPDLKIDFSSKDREHTNIQYYSSHILLNDNIDVNTAYKKLGKHGEVLVDFLVKCNEILKKTPFSFAYRLRNESLLYCYHNFRIKKKPQDWFNICLDEILNMKILPRVEGDRPEINECLRELETLCREQHLNNAKEKISEMLLKFDLFGYTSYFN